MARGDREGPRERFRVRVIAFVLVPVLVLAVCYFLLVEYVAIRPDVVLGTSLVGLRLGGLAVILLAVVLAIATGYLLADRVARPIRLLLHLAESGELPSGAGLFVHHRDWEVFLLYRRIHALIQQNRAGAAALDELESLRHSFDALRESLQRTGQNGVLAPIGAIEGPCEDIAALLETHRGRLLDFFHELRTRTEEVRAQLDSLESVREEIAAGAPNGVSSAPNGTEAGHSAPEPISAELRELAGELRRIGTVLSLEVELARAGSDDVGGLYREFGSAIGRLEEFAEKELIEVGDPIPPEPQVLRNADGEEVEVDDGSGLAAQVGSGAGSATPESTFGNGSQKMIDAWQQLREDLGSLERRLEEVEER